MIVQGLLVVDQNGQDFLLTTEHLDTKTHRLVVLQHINGRWQQVKGTEESARRESLIGAFVDFFVDICRVLNASGPYAIPATAPARGRSRPRASAKTKAWSDV